MAILKIPLNFYRRLTKQLKRAPESIYTVPFDRASTLVSVIGSNVSGKQRTINFSLSAPESGTNPVLLDFPLEINEHLSLLPDKVTIQEGDSLVVSADIEDLATINDEGLFWLYDIPTDITEVGLELDITSPTEVIVDWGALDYRNRIPNENFDDWSAPVIGPLPVSAGQINQNAGALNWIQGTYIPPSNAPAGTVTVSKETATPADFSFINTPYFARTTNNISSIGITALHLLTSESFGFLATTNQALCAITPNAISFLGKQVTLKFWARASQPTKIFSESQVFRDSATFWTPTIQKIFDLTTEWQQFTHTYTQPTYEQVLNAAYDPNTVDMSLSEPVYSILTALPPVSSWATQVDIKTYWSLGTYRRSGNASTRPPYIGEAMTLTELQDITDSFILSGYYDIAAIQYTIGDGTGNFTTQLSSGTQPANFVYDPILDTDTNLTLSILESNNTP